MKALFRCGFVALIFLGLTCQVIRSTRGDGDKDPVVTLDERVASLNVRTVREAASAGADVLTGWSPLCGKPLYVTLSNVDGSDAGGLQDLHDPGFVEKYVYLGSVEGRPSKVGMTVSWIWASVLFNVGSLRDKPSRRFVLVSLPRACPDLLRIDWSALSPWSS
jgi:hypothetical protein